MITKRSTKSIWHRIGKWLPGVFTRFMLDQLFDQLVTI